MKVYTSIGLKESSVKSGKTILKNKIPRALSSCSIHTKSRNAVKKKTTGNYCSIRRQEGDRGKKY